MSFKYPKSGKNESQKPPERKKTKNKSKKSKNKHKNKTSYIQEEEDNSSSSNDIKSDIYLNLYDNLKEKYDIEIEGMDIDSKTEEKSDNTYINNKNIKISDKDIDSNSGNKNNNDKSNNMEEQDNSTNNNKGNIFINTKSKLQENISTNISSGSLYNQLVSKKNKQNKNKDKNIKDNNLNTKDFHPNMKNLNEDIESFVQNKNKKNKNRIKDIEEIFESDEEQEEIESQFKNINFESGKQKQKHNAKEIINLFNQDNSGFTEPQTLTKSYFDIKGNLGLDNINSNSNYTILKKSKIIPNKNDNYTNSIDNLNDLLNQTYLERQQRKNLARKKLINSNRLKKYKIDKTDNFNTTDTLKKLDLLKQKINKEIPLKIEQFIPENYLQLLYKVQLPYWTNEDHSLNKLYISEYFSVIKYAPVITNVLQNSNIIKIRYLDPKNTISDKIVYSDLTFYNNIQIYSAGEFIGIKSFFNCECVVSNARVNMYYNQNIHNFINHTIDKIFIYYGIMNMFYKAESYSNKKTENLPSKRTSLAMYCISCGLFMCPDHFKKYEHGNEDQPDPCSFYNNLEKYDFYYFLFNFRLYLDSVNNISKFFSDNLNKDTVDALIESLAYESDTNEDLMESIFLYNTNNQDDIKFKNIYSDKKVGEETNINNISTFLPILISKITAAIFKNEGMKSKEKINKSEEN